MLNEEAKLTRWWDPPAQNTIGATSVHVLQIGDYAPAPHAQMAFGADAGRLARALTVRCWMWTCPIGHLGQRSKTQPKRPSSLGRS